MRLSLALLVLVTSALADEATLASRFPAKAAVYVEANGVAGKIDAAIQSPLGEAIRNHPAYQEALQTPQARQRQAFPMEPEAVVDAALSQLGKGPTIIAGRVNRAVYVLLGKLIPRAAAVRFFSRTTRGIYSERSPSS